MINDPDKSYITSGPYQLIKQYVIWPGAYLVNGLYNRRVKTRLHAKKHVYVRPILKVSYSRESATCTNRFTNSTCDIADVRINNQYQDDDAKTWLLFRWMTAH